MSFADKRAAITGAFFDRFAIGFLICVVDLPLPGWVTGLIVALLVSLPSAVVTKAYVPILGMGAVGGIVIGTFGEVRPLARSQQDGLALGNHQRVLEMR